MSHNKKLLLLLGVMMAVQISCQYVSQLFSGENYKLLYVAFDSDEGLPEERVVVADVNGDTIDEFEVSALVRELFPAEGREYVWVLTFDDNLALYDSGEGTLDVIRFPEADAGMVYPSRLPSHY